MEIFFRATAVRFNFVGLDSIFPAEPRGLNSRDYGFGVKLVCISCILLRELASALASAFLTCMPSGSALFPNQA